MNTTSTPASTRECVHGIGQSHPAGRMLRCTGPFGLTLDTPDGPIRFSPSLIVKVYPPKKWRDERVIR